MGKRYRRGVAWDARTGMKVKGHKLREDARMKGIWTTDPDPIHPQDLRRPPGPDGMHFLPGQPPQHSIGATPEWKGWGGVKAMYTNPRPVIEVTV